MKTETGLSSVFTTSEAERKCWDLAFEVQAQPSKSVIPMKNSQALSTLCMDPWALVNKITDTEQPLCASVSGQDFAHRMRGESHLCH